MKSREACIMSKRGQWVSVMYNSHSFVAEIAQLKLIRSWSCLKARPRPRPVVKTKTVSVKTKIKTAQFKTKTKTGRFGLQTTRDQDHGLEDNNTDRRNDCNAMNIIMGCTIMIKNSTKQRYCITLTHSFSQ